MTQISYNHEKLEQRNILIRSRQGWLIPGNVSEDQFWLLIGISSMHSIKMIQALSDHLIRGLSRKESCDKYKVNSGHFSIGLNRLQHLSHSAAKLAKHY